MELQIEVGGAVSAAALFLSSSVNAPFSRRSEKASKQADFLFGTPVAVSLRRSQTGKAPLEVEE